MTQKAFDIIAAMIFTIVGLVHLARIAEGWNVVVANAPVAMAVSWAGLIVTIILAIWGFKLGLRKP